MSVKELGSCNDDGEVKLEEVKEEDFGKSMTSGRDGWTLDELVPITVPISCKVPQHVVIFMRTIESLMATQGMGALEFGVFLKGKFQDGVLNVDADHQFIPQQKVSGVTVDFEEDPPTPDFNGVIHRHPTGCKSFSGTDSQHINRNFEFSLLYEGNDIIKGIINVKCSDIRIQLPLNIEVQYPVFNIENQDLIFKKIQRNSAMMSSSKSSRQKDVRSFGRIPFTNKLLTDGLDDDDGLGTLPFDEPIQDSDGSDREEYKDEFDGDLYICRYCGEPNVISEFPHVCDSCNMVLGGDNDAEEILDITDLEPDIQQKALEKISDHKSSDKE